MSPEVVQAIAQVMVGLVVAGSGVAVMETFRRRGRLAVDDELRATRVTLDATRGILEASLDTRPKKMTIADVPCGLCQQKYNAPHHCEEPYYCPCDHSNLHLDVKRIETLPVDPRTPMADSPKPRPPDEIEMAPLEFDRPVFDIIGGKCRHEEHISELGSFNVWCARCGVELEEKTAYDGRLIWRPVKGPKGCTHEAQDLEMVYLNDGLLVAWICTKCNIDGRFPWPEEAA